MIDLIDTGQLATDLDANFFALRNIGTLDPAPPNLVAGDDPRLTDERTPTPGSVTDDSVAVGAAISQSKLNLNGVIPPAWLGTGATQAAEGALAEYLANKGQPGGYAGLDVSGKIPIAQVPTAVGTGTVTSVGLSMPGQFLVTGSPVTGAGTLSASWVNVADQSWFGNKEGVPGAPQFYTTPLPLGLIPPLDAAIIVSGVIDPARLPAAVGLGGSHAAGAVPDPGDGSGGALATDYLARDMSYQPVPTSDLPYQPTVGDPVLTPSSNITGPQTIVFAGGTPEAQLFYSLTSAITGFVEVPSTGYISLDPAAEVWCYGAKAGYNNSNMVNYTNPNP